MTTTSATMPPIVLVTWIDPQVGNSWQPVGATLDKFPRLYALGFLIRRTAEVVTLAGMFDPCCQDEPHMNAIIELPAGCILDVKEITIGKQQQEGQQQGFGAADSAGASQGTKENACQNLT